MSTVTRPRGPLPARVYWIRRIVVLSVSLLLVVGVARLLGGGSDGKSTDDPQATQAGGTPTSTAPRAKGAASGTVSGAASAKAKAPAKRGGTQPPLAQPDGPCDPSEVTVKAALGRTPAGSAIQVPLVLRGTTPACTFRVSPDSVVVKIVSGKDNIWSSIQCPAIPTQDVVVGSAVDTRVVMVWHGRRSDEECSRSAGYALPGFYHVISAALGGEPSDVQFELTAPPRPRVTKTAKPRQRATAKPSGAAKPG